MVEDGADGGSYAGVVLLTIADEVVVVPEIVVAITVLLQRFHQKRNNVISIVSHICNINVEF